MTNETVSGGVAAGFSEVKEAFASNFSRDDIYTELGAALCVYVEGRRVADLWGGYADPQKRRPWTPETVANVFSATKALVALCVAMLVDRKAFDYADRLCDYWPEFGGNGKEMTTIGQCMSHQSGKHVAHDDLMNWALICDRLARQRPYWKPGDMTGYHGWTYGFLAGELVRRVYGMSIGEFLRTEIAEPLGVDAYIGLPQDKDAQAAVMVAPKADKPERDLTQAPDYLVSVLSNPPMDPLASNRREWRAAEIPGVCGFASARGLAAIFARVVYHEPSSRPRLLSDEVLRKMTGVASSRVDAILGIPVNWGHGVVLNSLGFYGPNPDAFGHNGWGGSVVCADAKNRVSIGYVCNQMGPDIVGDQRTQALINAVYRCI